MEEKQSRQPLLYLFVALTASVCLAVSIAYLEIRRDSEVEQLRTEVAMLLQYVEVLKVKLNRTETFTKKIDEMMKKISKAAPTAQGGTAGGYDDEDEYYDDYDEYYDDLKVPNSTSRERRSIDNIGGRVHNVLHMRTHPLFQHASDQQVMAKIVIAGDEQPSLTDRPNHQYHRKEEEILRHNNNGKKHHKNPNEDPEELNNCCHHRPILAHFSGDTSSITHERHYEGNHRLYHPDGLFRPWTPASWVRDMGMDTKLEVDRGMLTVTDSPGVYYFYVQIFYADVHDSSGYRVLVNDRVVLQCTTTAISSHGSVHHIKRNSCYTGGLLNLNRGDRISLRELEGRRYTVFEHTKSFFGLFRVAKTHSS